MNKELYDRIIKIKNLINYHASRKITDFNINSSINNMLNNLVAKVCNINSPYVSLYVNLLPFRNIYLNSSNSITAGNTTTIDLSNNNIFKVSLGTDISSLSLTNAKPGTYIIEIIQGGTNNVTFPSDWRWASGLIPIITPTANKIDIITLVYDGSNYFASAVQNF